MSNNYNIVSVSDNPNATEPVCICLDEFGNIPFESYADLSEYLSNRHSRTKVFSTPTKTIKFDPPIDIPIHITVDTSNERNNP